MTGIDHPALHMRCLEAWITTVIANFDPNNHRQELLMHLSLSKLVRSLKRAHASRTRSSLAKVPALPKIFQAGRLGAGRIKAVYIPNRDYRSPLHGPLPRLWQTFAYSWNLTPGYAFVMRELGLEKPHDCKQVLNYHQGARTSF